MNKPRLATVWLDGCSGCHMSFLDLDERLIEIDERAALVYSPLIDAKEYPDGVDVCLVEGAVATEEDLAKIRMIRERTRVLVSFGELSRGQRVAVRGLGFLFQSWHILNLF
jgi:NAD-reducing hydrogenase small subunit